MIGGIHTEYSEFLKRKQITSEPSGFDVDTSELNSNMFEWQADIVKWALKKGKACLFEDCGLGKTIQQISFSDALFKHYNKPVLIVSPLAVAAQTVKEGEKFGVSINLCRTQEDVINGINITNYEMLEHFNSDFIGIVLDESSILKNHSGSTRKMITDKFKDVKYKLCCTATPAPNDFMEIGNHAEFLGVMTQGEMLSTFFIHDGGDTAKWRLKGHAKEKFFVWVASWACCLTTPADLGYDGSKYHLPPLNVNEIIVKSSDLEDESGHMMLLPKTSASLLERRQARKESLFDRVSRAAEIANGIESQVLVWCDLNAEGDELKKQILNSVEVRGSDTDEHKRNTMMKFSAGELKCLISKPKIAGFGMNWQNCSNVIFVGLSDSFESYYQAVRRCWRFGQDKPVNVYIITSEKEGCVKENIQRKQADAERMTSELVKYTKDILTADIKSTVRMSDSYYACDDMVIPKWLKGDVT